MLRIALNGNLSHSYWTSPVIRNHTALAYLLSDTDEPQPDMPVLDLLVPEGYKAEFTLVVSYTSRRFICSQTVTRPSSSDPTWCLLMSPLKRYAVKQNVLSAMFPHSVQGLKYYASSHVRSYISSPLLVIRTRHQVIGRVFAKYWPVFKIL